MNPLDVWMTFSNVANRLIMDDKRHLEDNVMCNHNLIFAEFRFQHLLDCLYLTVKIGDGGIRFPHTLRHSNMPNSVWISPNKTMRKGFAEMFNIPIKQVKTVYHAADPDIFFGMHPMSIKLIEKHRLYEPDILSIFPCRMDSPSGKGMYEAIRLIGALNQFCDAKIVFLTSSVGETREHYISNLKDEARKWLVPDENIVFSSDMGKKWKAGVPRRVVKDLFQISNVFIFLSKSETFSWVALEAAMTKNMLVLNGELEVFRELFGDRAEYVETGMNWGGKADKTNYWQDFPADTDMEPYRKAGITIEKTVTGWRIPNEKRYWAEKAEKIVAKLGHLSFTCEHCGEPVEQGFGWYKPLMQQRYALKTFRDEWVWKEQLGPLIEKN